MKKNITYFEDDDGNWTKTTWSKQCPNKDIFRHKCQGVKGHKGNHWMYKPNGDYHYWANEDDPNAIDEDTAMGTIPPGHDSYVDPLKKGSEYYMKFYENEKITDPRIISELERNNPPEEDAVIDRPISENEIKELQKHRMKQPN